MKLTNPFFCTMTGFFDKKFSKTESRFFAKLRNFRKTEKYEIYRFGNFPNFQSYVVKFPKICSKTQIFGKLRPNFPKTEQNFPKTQLQKREN